MKRLQTQAALYLVSVQAVAVMCFDESHFELVTNGSLGVFPLRNGWQSVSPVSCAVRCVKTGLFCRCFTYNQQTKVCLLGGRLSAQPTSRDPAKERLYTRAVCREDQGLVWHTYNAGSLCFWLSPSGDTKIQLDAEKSCKDALIKHNINNRFWIGLTDKQTEDRFRWRDDGSLLSTSLREILFSKGESSDSDRNEDCVEYNGIINSCDDIDCSLTMRYMCEDIRDIN